MKTGLVIKELRIKKGLTQEELAARTELSARTIQRIENGEVDPRAYSLQMIAKALDVDFSLFVEDEPEETQNKEAINRHRAAFMHLSGILPLIFPTLIIWNHTKHKTVNIANHFRAAIIMQLIVLVISLGGVWVYWMSNQPFPLIGGLLAGCLIAIMNSIFVMIGKPYLNPFVKKGEVTGE